MKQNLADLEFLLLIRKNGREMLWKGTKIAPSQISLQCEWNTSALGSFRTWRGPWFPRVFFSEDIIFQAVVTRLQAKATTAALALRKFLGRARKEEGSP